MSEDDEEYADIEDNNSSITIPKLKNWKIEQVYKYNDNIVDYEDLQELGTAINAARIALFRVTDRINEYERAEKEQKIKYDREFRRQYLNSVDKTESQKRMRAELFCEDLENDYIVAEQLKNELVRTSHALRLELQTLQAIGNNLRQQMKVE